jgi:hypothetical protein
MTRVLGAERSGGLSEGLAEFEYVRVEIRDDGSVSFVLDDGERITVDGSELRRALDEAQAA